MEVTYKANVEKFLEDPTREAIAGSVNAIIILLVRVENRDRHTIENLRHLIQPEQDGPLIELYDLFSRTGSQRNRLDSLFEQSSTSTLVVEVGRKIGRRIMEIKLTLSFEPKEEDTALPTITFPLTAATGRARECRFA